MFLNKLVNPLGVSKQARIAASVIFFVVGFVSLLIGAVLAWSVSDPMAHLRFLPTTFLNGEVVLGLKTAGTRIMLMHKGDIKGHSDTDIDF